MEKQIMRRIEKKWVLLTSFIAESFCIAGL